MTSRASAHFCSTVSGMLATVAFAFSFFLRILRFFFGVASAEAGCSVFLRFFSVWSRQ